MQAIKIIIKNVNIHAFLKRQDYLGVKGILHLWKDEFGYKMGHFM